MVKYQVTAYPVNKTQKPSILGTFDELVRARNRAYSALQAQADIYEAVAIKRIENHTERTGGAK